MGEEGAINGQFEIQNVGEVEIVTDRSKFLITYRDNNLYPKLKASIYTCLKLQFQFRKYPQAIPNALGA